MKQRYEKLRKTGVEEIWGLNMIRNQKKTVTLRLKHF